MSNEAMDDRALDAILADALRPGLLGPGEVQVLVSRVMSALPPSTAMIPAIRPAIRVAFGLTATAFAFAARTGDLRAWFDHASLGLIGVGAALGAGSLAISMLRQAGGSLKAVFSGKNAQVLLGSAFSALVLAVMWYFVGSLPEEVAPQGVHAARMTLAVVTALLVAGTVAQTAAIARGAGTESALRMVEGLGLGISAVACLVSYTIFAI